MAIARSRGAFLGTDESTTVSSLANNATSTGSQVDVLGDDASRGWITVYLIYTGSSTSGTLDIRINPIRATGQAYQWPAFQFSLTPESGTALKRPIGRFPASRYMSGDLKNNGLGSSITNFALLFELEKDS